MLRVDPQNPRAVHLAERLHGLLAATEIPSSVCVVIGGDGWMLGSIHELGPTWTFLGLNAGTLGFLLNDVGGTDVDARSVASAIRDATFQVYAFPRLAVQVENGAAAPPPSFAMNDVYAERMTGKSAHLRLTIDGVRIVDRMVTDGVVIATALGSTAYSFSAGGPACHPLVRAVHVTPICPHTPRLPSLTLPEAAEIEIETLDADIRPVRSVSDGHDLGPIMSMRIGPAADPVKLAFLEGHQFTRTLVRKLIKA
jgi:NAD+ kinase